MEFTRQPILIGSSEIGSNPPRSGQDAPKQGRSGLPWVLIHMSYETEVVPNILLKQSEADIMVPAFENNEKVHCRFD